MSIPEQPGQTEPAPSPSAGDAAIAATVDFLLAHAGLDPAPEERAWLVRAYTKIGPTLLGLHHAAARNADPAFTFDAAPERT